VTPETIRMVSQLRREFYSLFEAAMKVPVKVFPANSFPGNSPMAYWIDSRQRLNYICIYAYTAPDKLIPERPFILRISVNKGAGTFAAAKRGKDSRGLNHSWCFELTVLPEEILDFLPWIVNLINASEKGLPSSTSEPPHPFDFKTSNSLLCNDAWTQSALQIADELLVTN